MTARAAHQLFRLDPSYRRPGTGNVVVGGSPLRLFRLGVAGVAVAEAIESGGPLPHDHGRLTNRLVDAGAIHPVLHEPSSCAIDASSVTVVIPCYSEVPLHRPSHCRRIVVDDASPDPVGVVDDFTEVVRVGLNAGPGASRNTGLALVGTPFVAFVDSDVSISDDDLLLLTGHFADPAVALVAPRIRASPGSGVLCRYEQRHSPLDLGEVPARIAPTTRVSYVPAAVVVCRTEALRALGGFDTALRFGEDVDLEWRLVAAGWRCRYEPAVVALHRTRPTLRRWLAQRFRYGTSAAPLAQRHPGALAPLRMSGWSAATWAPVAMGIPLLGALAGATSSVLLVRRLPFLPPAESLRLAGLGNLHAGRLIASAITRTWWPVAVALALVSRRARRVLAAALAVPVVIDWFEHGLGSDPVRTAGLRLLDDAAYGAGVWAGSIRHRRSDALVPAFVAWPGAAMSRSSGPATTVGDQ